MPQRAVRPAEAEVVGEPRGPDTEVGRHAVLGAPEVAKVDAVAPDEGKAWDPGGVEAGGAENHIYIVMLAVLREARFVDGCQIAGEYHGVFGDEGFEVSRCWRGPATPRVEVLGDDGFAEAWVVVEFALHLREGVVSRVLCGLRAFDDEFEALVQLVFDLFAVFEVLLRVLV